MGYRVTLIGLAAKWFTFIEIVDLPAQSGLRYDCQDTDFQHSQNEVGKMTRNI